MQKGGVNSADTNIRNRYRVLAGEEKHNLYVENMGEAASGTQALNRTKPVTGLGPRLQLLPFALSERQPWKAT